MTETEKVLVPILSKSPTLSSVVKAVPEPVTTAVLVEVVTVPVSCLLKRPERFNKELGEVVPIPTFPFARILIFSVLLVMNLKSLLSVVPKVARPPKEFPLLM